MKSVYAIASLALLSTQALAAPITYDFSGSALGFGSSYPPDSPYTLELPPGLDSEFEGDLSFTGSVTVEHATPDSNPDVAIGYYAGAVLGMSVQFRGIDFTFGQSSALDTTNVFAQVNADDSQPSSGGLPSNSIQIAAAGFQPAWLASLGTGNQLARMSLFHSTRDLSVISTDALPASLETFGRWSLSLGVYDDTTSQDWMAFASVQLTRRPDVSVPEPGSLALMGFGLAAIALRRRVAKGGRHPS